MPCITDMKRRHSKQFLETATRKDRLYRIANPDGYGKNTGECGDTLEFFLLLDGDRIENAFFQVNGCLNTVVCGNTVAEFTVGRRVEEAWRISPEQVVDYLETLPADHHHCAELAVGAMYRALADLRENRERPWRRLYKIRDE